MAVNQRLVTDSDFQEAVEKGALVRVFKDNHIVDSNAVVLRFSETTVVLQSRVADLAYYNRDECEFFEMKKR